jgi:alkylation response protein AidB-like acyl-CoA dehydrogenase
VPVADILGGLRQNSRRIARISRLCSHTLVQDRGKLTRGCDGVSACFEIHSYWSLATLVTAGEARRRQDKPRAGSVLIPGPAGCHLPAETAVRSTITQIYEGANQIQRVVMARQLLKG